MFERFKNLFKGKSSVMTAEPKAEARPADKPEEKPRIEKGKTREKAAAASPEKKKKTPDELCGITSKMGKNEIRERLALLYKRYNRASSSLDAGVRAEAEEMLNAIVVVREKVFGPI